MFYLCGWCWNRYSQFFLQIHSFLFSYIRIVYTLDGVGYSTLVVSNQGNPAITSKISLQKNTPGATWLTDTAVTVYNFSEVQLSKGASLTLSEGPFVSLFWQNL